MRTFITNTFKNDIDSMFNSVFVVMQDLNADIKKIMLNIMTTFSAPQLQVAYA